MDPNKKITAQDWLNQETQKLLGQFVSNTSNNTPENPFQVGLGAVGSFAEANLDWKSEHKENLISGAFGFVPPALKQGDDEANGEEEEKQEGGENQEEEKQNMPSGPIGKTSGGLTTAADNFKSFFNLGDPDRIKKRQEIKSARKENRATNRLRRAGETNYTTTSVDKDTGKETTTTGEKIPTRKAARKVKKDRIRKAKVKFDNKTVEKNKQKE